MHRLAGVPKRGKREEGQALVELALVIPILLTVLFGIVQFGLLLNTYITVTDAARSGARQLALEQGNNDPCDPAVQVATTAGSAAGISTTMLTITFASPTGAAAPGDYCLTSGTSKTPVTSAWPSTSYPYPAGNSSATAANPGAEVQGDTATMTVTKPFLLQFFGFKFGKINLTASASDAVE
jgi:Flp pilus assembly protein TadG